MGHCKQKSFILVDVCIVWRVEGLTAPAVSSGCSPGERNAIGDGPYTWLPGSRGSMIWEGMEVPFLENSDQRASSEYWSRKAEDQITEGSGKCPRTLGPGRNTSFPA